MGGRGAKERMRAVLVRHVQAFKPASYRVIDRIHLRPRNTVFATMYSLHFELFGARIVTSLSEKQMRSVPSRHVLIGLRPVVITQSFHG